MICKHLDDPRGKSGTVHPKIQIADGIMITASGQRVRFLPMEGVDYDDYDYCPNCGQKLDLDRDEQPTAFSMRAKPIDNFVNPFETKAGGING